METLSPKFRSVVNLRLAEGYSTEETAKILHIPVGTVLSRLQRAQKKLQLVLQNYKEGF
jgi:RNA polymerase sigma-70 factor (ECF subfamily)